MNRRTLKSILSAVCISAFSVFGLAACNTGTDAGETNTERSGIEYPEDEQKQSVNSHYTDSTDLEEKYYEGRRGTAITDSAAVQGGPENREKRGEHNKQGLKKN